MVLKNSCTNEIFPNEWQISLEFYLFYVCFIMCESPLLTLFYDLILNNFWFSNEILQKISKKCI